MNQYTVSELADEITALIKTGFNKGKSLILVGEISNLRFSGKHTYLVLKDENATISVAFWGTHLSNSNGDNVEITGKLDYYAKSNNINFIGSAIKNIGIGSVHTEYEKRYKEYSDLGYFNNRKDLPQSICNVGVVTSKDGAALQDFIYVVKNNGFIGNIYVYNCQVQGDKCHQSISTGIKYFNNPFYVDSNSIDIDTDESSIDSSESSEGGFVMNHSHNQNKNKIKEEVDIIVVTRGGGSFEDLMGFSHPSVIEAIYHSKKYIISAVGHEIDNMLSDYVANYRAPTPSIAGGVICNISSNKKSKLNDLDKKVQYIKQDILYKLKKFRDDVTNLKQQIIDPNQLIKQRQDKMNDIIKNIQYIKRDILFKLTKYKENVINLRNKIIDPYSLLGSKLNDLTKMKDLIRLQILDNIDKYKNRINNIQANLETTVGTEKSKAFLEQGFVLFTNSKGYIIYDIESMFDKNIKMIHSTGTYDIIINKLNKSLSSSLN